MTSDVDHRPERTARAPKVSMHPVLSSSSFQGEREVSVASVLDAGHLIFCTSGRYGLARALEAKGVGSGDEVLVPAYHCPAMTAPAIARGAKPVFYKLRSDLSIDVDDLRAKLSSRAKCLIAVHYFGFMQDLRSMRTLCDENGLVLIEDCAHCFYGEYAGISVGTQGHFAIASPMKFFPMYDGGCLVSTQPLTDVPASRRAGIAFESKSFFNILERSYRFDRLPLSWLVKPGLLLKDLMWKAAKSFQRRSHGAMPPTLAAADGGHGFDPAWSEIGTSRASLALMHRVSKRRVVERRRANYLQLFEHITDIPGCHPLYSLTEDGIVPYVFPVVVEEDEERVYRELKLAGVPLLRWDEAKPTECGVSERYSRQLLMFPCHQELDSSDLHWMLDQLATVISETRQGAPELSQAAHP